LGPEALAGLLHRSGSVTQRPEAFEVEAVLEALTVEGEVLP